MDPKPLGEWAASYDVPDEMIYKPGAMRQVDHFREVAEAMGAEAFVVSTHRSKSIDLPVVEF